jgi:hypothetical protein
MYNDIPENIIDHIREEMRKIEHGKITIELHGNDKNIRVVTESSQRFLKGEPKKVLRVVKKYHQG